MVHGNDAGAEQRVRVNIRFACWEREKQSARWLPLVAEWLGSSLGDDDGRPGDRERFAGRVLCDLQVLSPKHVKAVADALSRDQQELFYGDWPAATPGLLLKENLRRLLADPGEQTKAQLAEELGVSPATLSRWIGGPQIPDKTARAMIANLFGLRSSEELESSPIFLSYLPVTHGERVAWLSSRLRDMSWRELHELFPALLRIFGPLDGALIDAPSKRSELRRLKRTPANR